VKRFTDASNGIAGNPSHDELFGRSLAIGNLGKTAGADLAIDAPGQIEPTGGGAVFVLFRGANGVTGSGSLALPHATTGVPGDASGTGWGGNAIAALSLGKSSVADLVVAHLTDDVAGGHCGAAYVLYGAAKGPSGTGSQRFTPNTAGIAGACSPGP